METEGCLELKLETEIPSFNSLDAVQDWVLRALLQRGSEVAPRGLSTLELYRITFDLQNPRNRLITNKARRWSLPLAVGEFAWHVSGSNELRFIEYYGPRWKEFAENGSTIDGSCYGYRIFSRGPLQVSQWDSLVRLLKADKYSRRATLVILEPATLSNVASKDVACVSTVQFSVRCNKLHALVHMRSNDAIWGLPYDIFLFTMLQELLAAELGLEIGIYTHSVVSLHLYERHFKLAQRIIEEGETLRTVSMPPMEDYEQIADFSIFEKRIRNGETLERLPEATSLNGYWYDLLRVLDWYRATKLQASQNRHLIPHRYLPILTSAESTGSIGRQSA